MPRRPSRESALAVRRLDELNDEMTNGATQIAPFREAFAA